MTRVEDEVITHFYYTGSALLFTTVNEYVLQTQNILDPSGTIVASKRFEGQAETEQDPYADDYFFYRYDIRGSVTNIVDGAGSVVKSYDYDEFGVTTSTGDAFFNEVTFTGSVADASGLLYMNARYYNPATARFLSQDTYTGSASVPWTQHLYAYCNNNPVNMVDPTGHRSIYRPPWIWRVDRDDGSVTPPSPRPTPEPQPQPSPEMTPSPAATPQPSTTADAQPTPLPPGVAPTQGKPSRVAQLCYSVIKGVMSGVAAVWNAVEVEAGLGLGMGVEGEIDPVLNGSLLAKIDPVYINLEDGQFRAGVHMMTSCGITIGGEQGLLWNPSTFHPYHCPLGHRALSTPVAELCACPYATHTNGSVAGLEHFDGSEPFETVGAGGACYCLIGGNLRIGFNFKKFFEELS